MTRETSKRIQRDLARIKNKDPSRQALIAKRSKKAGYRRPFRQGDNPFGSNNEVIEYANVDQRERLFQPPSDELIRLAWLRDAARMLGFIRGCQHSSYVPC